MRFHDLVFSTEALTFHLSAVAVMSMVFDFAFLLLVVTFSFGPLMVSSSLNLNPRIAHQTLIRSLLVFILKDSKHSRLQAFGRTLCHRPRNSLSHS